MMLRLHGYFRSSAAYRCRIAFNLKGVAYQSVGVDLRRGEQKSAAYRARNPQGMAPMVETDDLILTQSQAIIEWLDETVPDPPFLPDQPGLRAQVRAFVQIIACDIHPLQNLRVLQYLESEYDCDREGINRWCGRWLGDGLGACEALLSRRDRDTSYCFGDSPGLADIFLVPQIFSAVRFGVDLSAFGIIRRIHAACEDLPAFVEAHPTRQPDFKP